MICNSKLNLNDISDLEKLFQFTFKISRDCPNEILELNKEYKCEDIPKDETHACLFCWRNALGDKIKELRKSEINEINK